MQPWDFQSPGHRRGAAIVGPPRPLCRLSPLPVADAWRPPAEVRPTRRRRHLGRHVAMPLQSSQEWPLRRELRRRQHDLQSILIGQAPARIDLVENNTKGLSRRCARRCPQQKTPPQRHLPLHWRRQRSHEGRRWRDRPWEDGRRFQGPQMARRILFGRQFRRSPRSAA